MKKFCGRAFRKVRIKPKTFRPINDRILKLVQERNKLSGNTDQQTIKDKIELLDLEIITIGEIVG